MSDKKSLTCFECYPAYKLGLVHCMSCGLEIDKTNVELVKQIVTESVTVHQHGDFTTEVPDTAGLEFLPNAPEPTIYPSPQPSKDIPSAAPGEVELGSPIDAAPVPIEDTTSAAPGDCDGCTDCTCGSDSDQVEVDENADTGKFPAYDPDPADAGFDPNAVTQEIDPPSSDQPPMRNSRSLLIVLGIAGAALVIGGLLYLFVGPLQVVRDAAQQSRKSAAPVTDARVDAPADAPAKPAKTEPVKAKPAPAKPAPAPTAIDLTGCKGGQVTVEGSRVILKGCAKRISAAKPPTSGTSLKVRIPLLKTPMTRL
jgi:hypothetical protein